MEERELNTAWDEIIDWIASGLMKDGFEGIVLRPLGDFPRSSAYLARSAFTSDNFGYRKVAASLAGWISRPDLRILEELFQAEAGRDSSLAKDDFGRLECQSVVEDVVFSASRWARKQELRPPALDLLKMVVERTLSGQYWNTSSYAMVTIARYSPPYAQDLLRAFYDFAHQGKVDHLSSPSLTQEREFSENLMRKNKATLEAIEGVLVDKDRASRVKLRREDRALIDDLTRAAERFEELNMGA